MEESECPICYNELKDVDVVTLDCTHKYHFKCIFQWSTQSNQCPMCRCDLQKGRNPQNRLLSQPILPRRQRSFCEKFIDAIKFIWFIVSNYGGWIIIFTYIFLYISIIYVQSVQNEYFFNHVKNGDLDAFKSRANVFYGKISNYLKTESLNDAIRFNQVQLVEWIVDNSDLYEIDFNKKHLEYAEYHKNEYITNYIKTKLQNRYKERKK